MAQDTEQIRGKVHRAPAGFAFESSVLVPVVQPEPPDTLAELFTIFESLGFPIPEQVRLKVIPELELMMDDMGDRHSVELLTVMSAFLEMMVADATPLQVGQRMICLAYLAGKTEAKTQRELAQVLNVSPGRVTQIMQAIPSGLQSLCRLKSRTAKPRGIGEDKIIL